MTDRSEVVVDVLEQDISEAKSRLSISNIPLTFALQTVLRWPQERREGVSFQMPDRTVHWSKINELYSSLYAPRGPGLGGRVRS